MLNTDLLLFLYLLTGIIITFSITSLLIGLPKGGDKAFTILGIMGICVAVYIAIFPFAASNPSNQTIPIIGLLFFLTNFALLPWFICYYTNYCRRKLQWSLTALMIISYIILLTGVTINGYKAWNIIAHLTVLIIIYFGIKASIYQINERSKASGRLLLIAIILFSLLIIDDIFRMYFYSLYPFKLPPNILPLDYFMILFIIIMSVRLSLEMRKKQLFELEILHQEKRWGDLLENINLLVVEVNEQREIVYVNPYFLELTGYNKNDVLGQNYLFLIPESDKQEMLKVAEMVNKPEDLQYYKNTIVNKTGEKINISWSIVGVFNEAGQHKNSISIGSNVTNEVKAFEEIKHLKKMLEDENLILKAELAVTPLSKTINGDSDAIKYVLQRASQVAPTNTTVLLEGETGVGKELISNYIQSNSTREQKPFIKINCSAIPDSLFESELFGHEKGAFTGAEKKKKGMVEMADGGTLFLDEIGEFPMDLQPKLLRFLQEGEFYPLGSEVLKKVDVRIIAATNRELLKEIEEGRFRNDLYYRLYVYPITIPALRNRVDDIPELVNIFLKKYGKKHRKEINSISKLVIDELKKYPWPGNIRELENVIERAVIVSISDTIKMKDLSLVFGNKNKSTSSKEPQIATLVELERNHIILALKQTNWQIHGPEGAAQLLGINPNTLRSRIKKLDISKP